MTEQQFDTPRPVRLEIKIPAGDIRVTTGTAEKSTVAIQAPQQLIDSTVVELRGDHLLIEQRRRGFRGWLAYSGGPPHVEVGVPDRSSVEIATASGGVVLDGTFSGFEMNSASGDVRLTGDLEGDATVKNVSGDVRLPHVSGDLVVHTVSGDVEARSVDGSVSVQSISSDVRIGSLREGRVNVHSVSGDVELGVASGTAIDLDAGTTSGEVSSEVPLSDTPGDEPGPTLVIRSKTVSGDFRVFRAA